MTDPGEIDGVGHGIGRFHDRESAKTSAGRNFETTDTTRPGLDFSWNLFNLPCEVSDSSGTMIMLYTYLSDGTNISSLGASGNGVFYRGNVVYRKTGQSVTIDSIACPREELSRKPSKT